MSLQRSNNYSGIGCDCSLAGSIGSSWSFDGKTIYSSNGSYIRSFQHVGESEGFVSLGPIPNDVDVSNSKENAKLHYLHRNSLTESYGLCYNSGKSEKEDTEMSLVSLFTWKDGAILASDTRSTRELENGRVEYQDDFRKIHCLNDHLYFAITGIDSFYNGEDRFAFAEYILEQKPCSADEFCRAVGNLIFNSLNSFGANSVFLLYEFQQSGVIIYKYVVRDRNMDYETGTIYYGTDETTRYSFLGADYARQFALDSSLLFHNVEDAIQKTAHLFDRVKEISALYPISTVGGGTDIIYYDRYSDKIKKIRRDSKPL